MDDQEWLENEKDLVERAKKDDQSFALLYRHYFPKIYGYVFKRVGAREVAEDLLSDIFTKVFLNLKDYRHQGFSFGAWLYRIATNRLCDYYRRQSRGAEVELGEAENIAEHENSEKLIDQKIDRQAIEKVLRRLSRRYQEIINLRYFAEMENQEIAAALDISPAHAGVLIHRALKKFKSEYVKYKIL